MFASPRKASLLMVVLVACLARPTSPAPLPEARKTSDVRNTIDAWMECDDCTQNQADVVRKVGPAAIPILAALLHDGPSPDRRELARRQLVKTYQDMRDYEKQHPNVRVAMSQDDYVRTYLDSMTARYQIRSAAALAAIGGPQARAALEDSLRVSLRAEVKAAVESALQRLTKR